MIIIRSNSTTTTTSTAVPKFIKANVDNHFIDLSIFIIITPRIVSIKTTTTTTTATTIATINIIPFPAMRSEKKGTYSTVYSFIPLLNLRRYLCYNLNCHPLSPY